MTTVHSFTIDTAVQIENGLHGRPPMESEVFRRLRKMAFNGSSLKLLGEDGIYLDIIASLDKRYGRYVLVNSDGSISVETYKGFYVAEKAVALKPGSQAVLLVSGHYTGTIPGAAARWWRLFDDERLVYQLVVRLLKETDRVDLWNLDYYNYVVKRGREIMGDPMAH